MDRSEKLAEALGEFARTMLTDFPIQAILDRLVERIVDVLPVTSAGVTLISEGTEPRYVAASDAAALTLEKLQTSLGQGPCMSAYESGEAVTVPDLLVDDRFPEFVTSADAVGVAAVFALRSGRRGLTCRPRSCSPTSTASSRSTMCTAIRWATRC